MLQIWNFDQWKVSVKIFYLAKVHHVIIIFGTIALKILIYTDFSFLFFFVNLVFLICKSGKREENCPKWPINLSTLQLHSLHFVIIFGALVLVLNSFLLVVLWFFVFRYVLRGKRVKNGQKLLINLSVP